MEKISCHSHIINLNACARGVLSLLLHVVIQKKFIGILVICAITCQKWQKTMNFHFKVLNKDYICDMNTTNRTNATVLILFNYAY